jgi:hypothetical protein
MRKFLLGAGLFILGVFVGWLNPIEGPLDWTYDEYASQPAHKYPSRVAPIQKLNTNVEEIIDEDDEIITPVVQSILQPSEEN